MNAAERVLPLLDHVRPCGTDSWRALCPAHSDNSPSLSIRAVDDRVLLHCWTGCRVDDVVKAIGLTVADLFDSHSFKPNPIAERERYVMEGFRQWREEQLCAIARELRERDFWISSISENVNRSDMTEAEAWSYLSLLYDDYSELERRFEILRIGTDREALDVYRSSELFLMTSETIRE